MACGLLCSLNRCLLPVSPVDVLTKLEYETKTLTLILYIEFVLVGTTNVQNNKRTTHGTKALWLYEAHGKESYIALLIKVNNNSG